MEAGPHGLLPCPRCLKLIARDADICPFCGYHAQRGRAIRRWAVVGAMTVLVVGAAAYGIRAAGGFAGVAQWFASDPEPAAVAEVRDTATDTARDPGVQPIGAATPIIAAAPAAITPRTPLPTFSIRYARNWANVRAGRNIDSAVVAVLRPGERVQAAHPLGGWWAVWADSVLVGYVATDLLSTTPVDSLP